MIHLEEDHGHRDNAEVRAHRGVLEVVVWPQAEDDGPQEVAARGDNVLDILAVFLERLGEVTRVDGAALLLGTAVGAAVHDGLQGEAVAIDAHVLVLDFEDVAHVYGNWSSQYHVAL